MTTILFALVSKLLFGSPSPSVADAAPPPPPPTDIQRRQ